MKGVLLQHQDGSGVFLPSKNPERIEMSAQEVEIFKAREKLDRAPDPNPDTRKWYVE